MKPTDNLAQTGQAFEQWRQAQSHPNAEVPASLRQAALRLLADFPVPRVAKALGLSSSSIYQWRKPTAQRKSATKRHLPAAAAAFVELPGEPAGSLSLSLTLAQDIQLTLHGQLPPDYVLQLIAGLRA